MTKPFVMMIAGPTGVGKTTLAKMLKKHYDCAYSSEDEIARDIFPDEYKKIEDYPDKVKILVNQLYKNIEETFKNGKCVVIDRINIEEEFIWKMKKVFHKHLILKILWPQIEITIERDKNRKGWTSGEDVIKLFYKKYEKLKPIIGEKNYIDTSHLTSEETLKKFIDFIELE